MKHTIKVPADSKLKSESSSSWRDYASNMEEAIDEIDEGFDEYESQTISLDEMEELIDEQESNFKEAKADMISQIKEGEKELKDFKRKVNQLARKRGED